MIITAKSVILDIANNYGDINFLGLRSVEFFLAEALIGITTEFTAYATTTDYEPSTGARLAFNTSLSKLGTSAYNQWYSNSPIRSNQRVIIVFDTSTEFDKIVINNAHETGNGTTRGAQNVIITSSTDAITDITYNAAITNSTELFNGVFDEHAATDTEDPQTVYLSPIFKGNFISPIVDIFGVGNTPITGYTETIPLQVIIAGVGDLPITGYTDFVSPLVSVDGTGLGAEKIFTEIIPPIVSVDGVGDLPITGYTDFISPLALGDATGNVYHNEGHGRVVTKPVSITISGTVDIVCAVALTPKLVSVTSVGVNAIRGAGYVKPKLVKLFGNYSAIGNVEVLPTIDAYGKVSIIGAGTVVTRPAGVTGYGQLSLLATTDYNTDAPTILGTGIIYQTGRGVISVPLPVVTTYGYLQSTGLGVLNVKPPVLICHANQPDDYTVIRHTREGTCQ